MSRIAVLADRETAAYFRLTGVKGSFYAVDGGEAEKIFDKVYNDQETSLIIVTSQVLEWVQPYLDRIRKIKDFPIVVSVPGKGEEKPKRDLLAELIRKTIGVEIKVG